MFDSVGDLAWTGLMITMPVMIVTICIVLVAFGPSSPAARAPAAIA